MMKNAVLILTCLILLAISTPLRADPVEEAVNAYQNGDYAKAAGLWEKMAAAGDARAMHNLGVLNEQGLGMPKNPQKAAKLYHDAAAAGHAAGMSNYARMLEQGTAVDQNLKEASTWFRKAADMGLPEAQYNLGLMYEKGQGIQKNEKEAAAWSSRAAAQGQTDAMSRLGVFYKDGRGVKSNSTRAVLLLYGASMEGKKEAIDALQAMAGKNPKHQNVALFGEVLAKTTRPEMRKALTLARAKKSREDSSFICDTYNVTQAVPGATELAACYGSGDSQPLGFIKIDYPASSEQQAEKVRAMVSKRFGKPDASENANSSLWNLGEVILAIQYASSLRQVSLMYMLPKTYHLTRSALP